MMSACSDNQFRDSDVTAGSLDASLGILGPESFANARLSDAYPVELTSTSNDLLKLDCVSSSTSKSTIASYNHGMVEREMDACTFGVVISTNKSFRNPYTIEELRFFSSKKNGLLRFASGGLHCSRYN
ncbi:hypothetical protein RND71_014299 [Anisodus tanguticus]|uniref:Uncharacterized protein n=1 Tax=Anisodus tanguticus TaxID=243964 RepID=A0AAE1S8U8_9SOLA|nr:hypothetical protein RND71_014299 [Anisodus tanguticus]